MANLLKEVALSANHVADQVARLAPWEQREKVSLTLSSALKQFASSVLDQARTISVKDSGRIK